MTILLEPLDIPFGWTDLRAGRAAIQSKCWWSACVVNRWSIPAAGPSPAAARGQRPPSKAVMSVRPVPKHRHPPIDPVNQRRGDNLLTHEQNAERRGGNEVGSVWATNGLQPPAPNP